MRVGYVLLGLVALASVHISTGQTCSNGLPGIQNENVCCELACGTCGGAGCATRPGGAASCCSGAITDGGMLCSVTGATPCIIDTCYNGLQGIQTDNNNGLICCDGACGACGGGGCGRLPGGSDNCCTGPISTDGTVCSVAMAAPCIVDNPSLCSDGTHGIEANGACCETQCGSCGGRGCGGRPGGPASCCTSAILDSNIVCADIGDAPCIVALLA